MSDQETLSKKVADKLPWIIAAFLFFLGIGLGGLAGGESMTENESLKTKIAGLKTDLKEVTSARDSFKARLDPIVRAEEASATMAAKVAAASTKAKTEAEAKAAAAKVKAELDAQAAEKKAEAEAQTASAKAAAEEAANTFTSGTYLVGTDIQPGTYRGTLNGESGYLKRPGYNGDS